MDNRVIFMKIRKQVYDLALADLATTPAWEFALDEEGEEDQDEATVRPVRGRAPIDPAAGMYVVRARFRLGDGTPLVGYLTPPVQGESTLPTIQPIIVTPRGQVMFWFGALAPERKTLATAYERLGRKAGEVFPVSYESDVPLVGGPVRGELSGFGYFRSFKDQRVVEVR